MDGLADQGLWFIPNGEQGHAMLQFSVIFLLQWGVLWRVTVVHVGAAKKYVLQVPFKMVSMIWSGVGQNSVNSQRNAVSATKSAASVFEPVRMVRRVGRLSSRRELIEGWRALLPRQTDRV